MNTKLSRPMTLFIAAGLAAVMLALVLNAADSSGTTSIDTNISNHILGNVTTNSPIDENDILILTDVFTTSAPSGIYDIKIGWGDGITEYLMIFILSGLPTPTFTHQYLDDDPTATSSDTYSINLSVMYNTETAVVEAIVNNVAPTVSASAVPTTPKTGTPVDFTGVFSDVGSLDTHTVLWDFGDGMTTTGSLSPTHIYSAMGVYDAVLTVTDDDGGVGSATVQIAVGIPTDVSLTSFARTQVNQGFRTAVRITAAIFGLAAVALAGQTIRRQRKSARQKN